MGRVGVRRGSDEFSDEGVARVSFAKRAGWIKVTDDSDVFVLVVIDKKILLG